MTTKYIFMRSLTALFVILLLAGSTHLAYGQLKEPTVRKISAPKTPLGKGYKNRIGASAYLNNFGFGIGGVFGHAIGPFTELTFKTGITGLRNASEQTFTNYFTGQRNVPNKYNRALGFPIWIGIKQRLFAQQVSDNFRFFVSGSGGPVIAFVYPYFNDNNPHNGYRDTRLCRDIYGYTRRCYAERKYGFFGGWGKGHGRWGASGQIAVGVDFGSDFKRQTTVEVGYSFYYFNPGIQILDPRKPTYDNNGNFTGSTHFNDPEKYFGTPQIKFVFSGWW